MSTNASSSTRDDKLVLLVRLCFTPLAVLTAIFGPLLMALPSSTPDYWAWTIRPDMSAFWVGASYTFGAIAITTMLILGRWRSTLIPVVSTWPFSVVMLAATVIHEDRFFTDTAGYYVWFVIYLILPFALPAMLFLNHRRAAEPDPGALVLPSLLRAALAVAGTFAAVVGLALVLSPSLLDQSWPWTLTPLMSRVIGGWLLFIATGALAPLVEPRYEAYRYYFPTAAVWFALLLVGSVLHSSDLDFGRPAGPLFVAAVGATVIGAGAIFVVMERRLRTASAAG